MDLSLVSPYDVKHIYTFRNEVKQILEGKMPAPRMVTFHPNYSCNLSCPSCHFRDFRCSDFIPNDKLISLIDECKELGIEATEWCGGGDWTVYPRIEEILKYTYDVAKLKMAGITNGVALKGSLLKTVISRFSFLRIGVDSFDKEIYKTMHGRDCIDEVVENIRASVRFKKDHNLPVLIGLKFLLTKQNCKQNLEQIIWKAMELGVDSVQFAPAYYTDLEITDQDILNDLNNKLDWLSVKHDKEIKILFKIKKTYLDGTCILTPLHLMIDARGDVFLCCFYSWREKTHKFGNIFEKSLHDIWYSQEHIDAIARIKPEECNIFSCKYHKYNKIMKEGMKTGQWEFL